MRLPYSARCVACNAQVHVCAHQRCSLEAAKVPRCSPEHHERKWVKRQRNVEPTLRRRHPRYVPVSDNSMQVDQGSTELKWSTGTKTISVCATRAVPQTCVVSLRLRACMKWRCVKWVRAGRAVGRTWPEGVGAKGRGGQGALDAMKEMIVMWKQSTLMVMQCT